MKNNGLIEMRAKDLTTYINTGYNHELDEINNWENTAIGDARKKRVEKIQKIEEWLSQNLSMLRTKYPEEMDSEYELKKGQLLAMANEEKQKITDSQINENISIRQEAHSRRSQAYKKLMDAQNELNNINN